MAEKLDEFTRGYIECALWSSVDEDGESLDSLYGINEIDPDTLTQMVEDCTKFQAENEADLPARGEDYDGHDFWLTRNGHGTGFWHRGLSDLGQRLTAASKAYGEYTLYIGDDGLIHGS